MQRKSKSKKEQRIISIEYGWKLTKNKSLTIKRNMMNNILKSSNKLINSNVNKQNTKYELKQNMNKKEKRIRNEKQKKKHKNNKKTNHCHYYTISTNKYGLCEFLLIELD